MTSHTSGPWIAAQTAGHEIHGQSLVYTEKTGKHVAIVYDGAADAHLIAAAPDLLEALERLQSVSDFATAARIIRAAIAKAKGE